MLEELFERVHCVGSAVRLGAVRGRLVGNASSATGRRCSADLEECQVLHSAKYRGKCKVLTTSFGASEE